MQLYYQIHSFALKYLLKGNDGEKVGKREGGGGGGGGEGGGGGGGEGGGGGKGGGGETGEGGGEGGGGGGGGGEAGEGGGGERRETEEGGGEGKEVVGRGGEQGEVEMNENMRAIRDAILRCRHLTLGGVQLPGVWRWVRSVMGGEGKKEEEEEEKPREEEKEEVERGDSLQESYAGGDAGSIALQLARQAMEDAKRELREEERGRGRREEEEEERRRRGVRREGEVEEVAMDTDADSVQSSSFSSGTPFGAAQNVSVQPISDQQLSHMNTARDISSRDTSWDNEDVSQASTTAQLVTQCVYGVAACAVRCPAYFKPIHRLASVLLWKGTTEVSERRR